MEDRHGNILSNEAMAIAAMSESMRTQTEALSLVLRRMDSMTSSVAKVREDIAVMKVRDEEMVRLRETCAGQDERIRLLEQRNFKQDGALSLGDQVHKWLPWLFAAAAWAWSVFAPHK